MTDSCDNPSLENRESGDGEEIIDDGANSALSAPTNQNSSWEPNSELVDEICALGFSKICAEKALYYTVPQNSNLDSAVGWILDHPEAQTDTTPLNPDHRGSYSSQMNFKMVFAVNASLKMGLGKIAAQVGHGTLGLYRKLERSQFENLLAWCQNGETKIVVRAEDDAEMENLRRRADLAGCQNYLVYDAGHTQVAAGSATVLAIFGQNEKIDEITGHLKLL